MNDQEKKLAIHFFVEQKLKEVGIAIAILFLIIFVPFATTFVYYSLTPLNWHPTICTQYDIYSNVAGQDTTCTVKYSTHSELSDIPKIGQWLIGLPIDAVLGVLIFLVYHWLKSNWDKAAQKAKQRFCKHEWKSFSFDKKSKYCRICGVNK